MKKSVKILTLVLSLALLCGVFAVAAFADDTAEIVGVTTRFSTNFDGGKSFGEGDGSVVKEFGIDNKGSGTSSTVIDEKGNSYFSWKYPVADKAGTAGNYSYTAPNSGKAWINPPDAMFDGYCYGDLLYYVADFDIWFPKNVPDGSVDMYAYNYYIKAEKATDPTTGEVTQTITGNDWEDSFANRSAVKFYNTANGGVAVTAGLGYGDQIPMLDGAWNHITLITSSRVEDGKFVLTHHMAVNGIIADSWDYELPTESDAYLVDGLPRWYPKTYRFEYGNDCKGNEMNLDNLTIRTIEKNYNGNLATVLASGKGTDLATWESNIYDVEKMPYSTTVAKIGDKEFDHLQRAVAAAKGGDTITLTANVTDVVTLGDIITIDCAGFTCPQPKGANGYVVGPMKDGKYVPEASQAELMIMWGGCTCGLPTCDETHPGDATGTFYTTAPLYGNLFESYETLGKSNKWTLEVGTDKYNLVGWMDATTGTIYNADTTVTKEMLELGFLMLTPIIQKTSVDVAYTKGGVEVYASGATALKDAITNSDAGKPVKLMNNFMHVVGIINIGKDLTLDLNGFKLMATPTNKDLSAKSGFLDMRANITIDGTKAGSAIFVYYASKDNVKDDGSIDTAINQPDAQMITVNAAKTLTINGGEDFYMNASMLARVNGGGAGSTININGGTYATDGAADGYGYIYNASNVGNVTVNVKNATITARGFLSSYNAFDGNVANFDNCKLLATNLTNSTNHYYTVNITNSYIAGNPTGKGGAVVIGEGNIIRENATWTGCPVTYAPGVAAAAIETPVTLKALAVQTKVDTVDGYCVVDPTSFDIFEKEYAATYTVKTEKALGVSFYDGETLLGTAYGKAGNKVVGPTAGAAESVADGWVMATKSYAYTIPADATADIKVDIKDVTEFTYTYAAGTPEIYYNYYLSDNMTTNVYILDELPEGITLTYLLLDTTGNGNRLEKSWNKGFVIGGKKFACSQSWPNAYNADEGNTWTLTYTYEGTTLDYTIKTNAVDYAKRVAKLYKDDAEKMQQITALLQYVESANKIRSLVDNKAVISNGLSEYLAELKTTVTIPAVSKDYTADLAQLAKGGYITGAKMMVVNGKGGSMALTLGDKIAENNYTVQLIVAGTTRKIATKTENNTIYTFSDSMTAWGAKDITINVLDAEGAVVATGTYSLAAYYNEMADQATADELALLEAMYALAYIGNTNN